MEFRVESGLDTVKFAFHHLRTWAKVVAKGRAKWIDEDGEPKLVLQIAEDILLMRRVLLMEQRVRNGSRAFWTMTKRKSAHPSLMRFQICMRQGYLLRALR